MPIKAIIFDLDGTIASFNVDSMAVRAEVRSILMISGLPSSILPINESIFEMLKKTEIFIKNSGKSERVMEGIRERALAIAEKYELEAAKTTSLLPGVMETLKALREMGLKIGLCTINSEKSTLYILKRYGIGCFFDAVTPRNKVKYVKPSTEHLAATLAALGVNSDEALIVGDGTIDMKCAEELKVIAVGVLTGVASKEQLIGSGADYLITTITDLPVLVRKIKGASES